MNSDGVLTPLYENLKKTQMKQSPSDDHSDSETHYETITEGRKKKFICSFSDCQKVFRFKSEIERHISVHSEAKPHACTFDKCNKSFKRADALENHIRSQHTGEAVLACHFPGCGLSFTTSSKLRYHTILHGGEKPYKCSVQGCDRSFVTLSQMKQHERSAIAHKKLSMAQNEVATRANSTKVDDEDQMEDFSADQGQEVIYDNDSTAGNFYNNFAAAPALIPEIHEYQPTVRKIVKLDNQVDQEQAELEEKEAILKRVCFENDALKDRLISTKMLISEMKMKFDQISIFPGENSAKSGFALPKHDAFIPSFEWVNGLEWGLFGNNGVEQAFMSEDRSNGLDFVDKRGSEVDEDLFTNFNFEDVPFLQMK